MANKAVKEIGARLKRIRRDKKLTQEDIATRALISTNYYALIERAEVNPSVDVLEKICKALEVNSSEVLPF
jgi:transcriptional regulator with XRE-family HTH domain